MELFFYYALFFIFRCIRGYFLVSKHAQRNLELMEAVGMHEVMDFSPQNYEKKREKMKIVNKKLKEKSPYENIVQTLDLLWKIAGIWIGIYRPIFIVLLVCNLASRIIPIFMKTKAQFKWVLIISNTIELISALYMVYLFINAQFNLL